MQIVNVNITNTKENHYPIIIGDNIQNEIINFLNKHNKCKAIIVTNSTIWKIYEKEITSIFSKAKIHIEYCILPDGEIYKNEKSIEQILTCAFENKLDRNDFLIAFGGGVIGDITGFAASIYLRGINLIQIPTTLLAQVDSSIGGKVGINTPYGKNLIGNFYQPVTVFSQINFLKTLPEKELLTGLSEVIKYSFIEKSCNENYENFAEFLLNNSNKILKKEPETMINLISKCCKLKTAVVNQDEKEKGLRVILNFGHTLAHSIEKTTNFSHFTHGEAVAIGIRGAFLIAKKTNKINKDYFEYAINLLDKYKLNYKIPSNIKQEMILDNLIYDKKVQNGQIRFVLPTGYGIVEIFNNIESTIILQTINELY